jgi:hypothetical protein
LSAFPGTPRAARPHPALTAECCITATDCNHYQIIEAYFLFPRTNWWWLEYIAARFVGDPARIST